MTQQVQCPHCGNYRITKPGTIGYGCLAAIIGLLAFGYLSLGLLSGSGEITLVVLVIFLAIVVAMRFARNRQPWVCRNCGYKWSVRPAHTG